MASIGEIWLDLNFITSITDISALKNINSIYSNNARIYLEKTISLTKKIPYNAWLCQSAQSFIFDNAYLSQADACEFDPWIFGLTWVNWEASFTYIGGYSGYYWTDFTNLFNKDYTGTYSLWYTADDYVEIDVNNSFRIWWIAAQSVDNYQNYDAQLKFVNVDDWEIIYWNLSDRTRNPSEWTIASQTIPAWRYKVYTYWESTKSINDSYRIDDEWYLEKMN